MRKLLPLLLLTFFLGGCSLMGTKTPEPSWQSVRQDGVIEIRDYDPMIVAEVTTTGERYAAINEGFKILAGYIFGGNTAQTKIAMTTPVTQESGTAHGEKIAMTAPVTQEPSADPNTWRVRFVMPPTFTVATLPVPKDSRILFLEIPAYRMAVIRFSGFNTDSNLGEHQKILMDWLATNNLKPQGAPVYAFYNPPWTLPFLKRNEVMVRIPAGA